jgi:hypothetical protein
MRAHAGMAHAWPRRIGLHVHAPLLRLALHRLTWKMASVTDRSAWNCGM